MEWSTDTRLPDHLSRQGIGLVTMPDGRILCVHRGRETDTTLWYTIYSNGTWTADKKLPRHFSANGASLAVYRGAVHCVHRGGDLDDWVYLTIYDAARDTWTSDERLAGVRSSRNPGLAVYKNAAGQEVLYCVHKGCDPDDRLWYTFYDGNGWTADRLISNDGHRTHSDPTLTVYGGMLYCLHQGRATDENIYYTRFDGNSWSPDVALPDHKTGGGDVTRGSIGAASDVDFLYVVHRGGKNDTRLWTTRFNGTTWSTDKPMGPGAHNGMFSALTIAGPTLVCVHEGYTDPSLWWTYATLPAFTPDAAATALPASVPALAGD